MLSRRAMIASALLHAGVFVWLACAVGAGGRDRKAARVTVRRVEPAPPPSPPPAPPPVTREPVRVVEPLPKDPIVEPPDEPREPVTRAPSPARPRPTLERVVVREQAPPPPATPPETEPRETAEVRSEQPSARVPATPAEGNRPPAYPSTARRRGHEGEVVLLVRITRDGAAKDVEVTTSSGHASLDRAAVAAVAAWRFVPAREGGVRVASTTTVSVAFRLDG